MTIKTSCYKMLFALYVFCSGHMTCDQIHAIKIPSGLSLAPWDSETLLSALHFISPIQGPNAGADNNSYLTIRASKSPPTTWRALFKVYQCVICCPIKYNEARGIKRAAQHPHGAQSGVGAGLLRIPCPPPLISDSLFGSSSLHQLDALTDNLLPTQARTLPG